MSRSLRNRCLCGVMGIATLWGGLCVHAGPSVKSLNGEPYYYDGATMQWEPAKVRDGKVYYKSGGNWYDSGATVYGLKCTGILAQQMQSASTLIRQHSKSSRAQIDLVASYEEEYGNMDAITLRDRWCLPYQDSASPTWEWRVGADVAFAEQDSSISDTAGAQFQANETALTLNATGRKGRLGVYAALSHERRTGSDSFDGVDSQSTHLLVMPAYSALEQGANGLNLNVHGLLDVGYVDVDGADAQQRATPGAGVAAVQGSRIGIVTVLYSFAHSRNLNGDEEVTGDTFLNTHSATGRYSLPITDDMVANIGIEHSYTPEVPDGMDGEATNARAGVTTSNIGSWDISLSYYRAVDGRDSQGGHIGIGRKW